MGVQGGLERVPILEVTVDLVVVVLLVGHLVVEEDTLEEGGSRRSGMMIHK
jgi:hypothetical protein